LFAPPSQAEHAKTLPNFWLLVASILVVVFGIFLCLWSFYVAAERGPRADPLRGVPGHGAPARLALDNPLNTKNEFRCGSRNLNGRS